MGSFRRTLGLIRRRLFGNTDDEVRMLKRKIETLEVLIKSMVDIRTLPKAIGGLRLMQVANTALLKLLADTMTRNGLDYWLESGTLLGAVRHKGFIPWDDDIDISVTRGVYLKIEKMVEKELPESEGFMVSRPHCMRFRFSGTPCQIDIFPYDVYNVPTVEQERAKKEIWEAWRLLQKKIEVNWSRLNKDGRVLFGMSFEEIDAASAALAKSHNGDRRLLLAGFEVQGDTDFFTSYESVFPLSEIEFEGIKFKAPHDCDTLLIQQYGDYMQYPRECRIHEDIRTKLSEQAIAKMKDLIKRAGLESLAAV